MDQGQLAIATATRERPGESENGDAWVVHAQADGYRVAVIDGLGHGPEAAEAAAAAVAALAAAPDLDPAQAIERCHRALAHTRGAAITVAVVDALARRLTYCGVGNVEGRLWQGGRQQRLILIRGIVGAALPAMRTFTLDLEPGWRLILHTDGVSARFDLEATRELTALTPQELAETLVRAWSRSTDDATVLVVAPRNDPIADAAGEPG